MGVPTDICAIVLGALAAAWDVRARRIPNGLLVATAVCGLALGTWAGGAMGGLSRLAALAAGLALMGVPYARRWVGGGDAKLLAALASLVGLGGLAALCLATAVAGGLLALGWIGAVRARGRVAGLLLRRCASARDAALAPADGSGRPRRQVPPVPYGVAMAAGVAAVVLAPGWWR